MQIDEVIRNSANEQPLEWLAKGLAVTASTNWSIKAQYRVQPEEDRLYAARMATAAYVACCQLDVWDYRGRSYENLTGG
jgi:hypothetical protein